MRPEIDETHDAALRSWVTDANGHSEFPIQNLPFGVFWPAEGQPRGGIAIGDHILDLGALRDAKLLEGLAGEACAVAATAPLNDFLRMGSEARSALRRAVSKLLAADSPAHEELLHRAADCNVLLPTHTGNYTDFYAGIHHARNVGAMFRPENPLLPNYKWVPIGYHGRASSVSVSGDDVRRPNGQRKSADEAVPTFGPSCKLDFELELGIVIGPDNDLGETIPIDDAHEHIGGYCLLNDWSARDIQSWEYQPLGPFLAKSFQTTVSPWIVTPEALAPFFIPQALREEGDPAPLAYLLSEDDQAAGALDITLEVLLTTAAMRSKQSAPQRLAISNAKHLYWTPAQMVAHHASNGCNLEPGDLLGTGTISAPGKDGLGSLLEMTLNGEEAVTLSNGETRTFLEDGDEVIMRAQAKRDGFVTIGFGECRAVVLAAS